MSGAMQPFRLAQGGLIKRDQPLSFRFDGRSYRGVAGDTLASALLANGVHLVGRSFKYHRPRGILTSGSEEPNALVNLRGGGRAEPNTRATMAELYEGLVAESQNRWPSLRFDAMRINDYLSGLFPAGFYYKTFLWPAGGWEFYERFVRKAAGLGVAPMSPDPDRYEERHAHCDVLVVGAGLAGLSAAREAVKTGQRVILVDENPLPGGRLRFERESVEGQPGAAWARSVVASLVSKPDVTVLSRTTAVGYYDHNFVAAIERVQDHVAEPGSALPRQRLWSIRAKRVILATGAIERPLVFAGNDRPGIMMASAVRTYANQFAVLPGRRVVVFTNNHDAYRTVLDLQEAGASVIAVVDTRPAADGRLMEQARRSGLDIRAGQAVIGTRGGQRISGIDIAPIGGGPVSSIPCDLLCMSGGWNPNLHLHCQTGGWPVYDERLSSFIPGESRQVEQSCGAARGIFRLADCLADGAAAGRGESSTVEIVPIDQPLAQVASGRRGVKRFVDFQDDVTAADVALAAQEGYESVEHLKRYTTLGMGTDQGKTSNVVGLALLAEARGKPVAEVGATTFRPPYVPVALGAFAGRSLGHHLAPVRRSAMHDWHMKAGAPFVEAGLWLRPRAYPRAGEDLVEAIRREAKAVRQNVGLVDVTTLGKIDIQGPDAVLFLDRLYANSFASLGVGRVRYGLMLREDGHVFDDGTVSRLDTTHYLITTTTANAGRVMSHVEFLLQTVWPELRVQAVSVTEQWAAMALAGPRSRELLGRVIDDAGVDDQTLPHLAFRCARLKGIPARLFRISYSGERAYEINVPSNYGLQAWEALIEAGKALDLTPYGTEAMGILRVEKGHVAGPELDGRTTARDLGMERLMAGQDFIGKRMSERAALMDLARPRLVGLLPVDRNQRLRAGAQIVEDPSARAPVPMIGTVTSAVWSPNLGHSIALALLSGGASRKGQTLHTLYPLAKEAVAVTVTDPIFIDPKGERLRG
jgi:heterotetrameric sarcosine oxidase alpha subunit